MKKLQGDQPQDVTQILEQMANQIEIYRKQYESDEFIIPTAPPEDCISYQLAQIDNQLKDLEEKKRISLKCPGEKLSFPHQISVEASFYSRVFSIKEALQVGNIKKAQDDIMTLASHYYQAPESKKQFTLSTSEKINQEILKIMFIFLTTSLEKTKITEIEYITTDKIFFRMKDMLYDLTLTTRNLEKINTQIKIILLNLPHSAYKFIKLAMDNFFDPVSKEKQTDSLETVSGIALSIISLFLFTPYVPSLKLKKFFIYCANVSSFVIDDDKNPNYAFSQERIPSFQDKWNRIIIEYETEDKQASASFESEENEASINPKKILRQETLEILKKKLEEIKKIYPSLKDDSLALDNASMGVVNTNEFSLVFLRNLNLFEEKAIAKEIFSEMLFYTGCFLAKRHLKLRELTTAYRYWRNVTQYNEELFSSSNTINQYFLILTFSLGKTYIDTIIQQYDAKNEDIEILLIAFEKGMNLLTTFKKRTKDIESSNQNPLLPSKEEIKELFKKSLVIFPKILHKFCMRALKDFESSRDAIKFQGIIEDISKKSKAFLTFIEVNKLFPYLNEKDKDFLINCSNILSPRKKQRKKPLEIRLKAILEEYKISLSLSDSPKNLPDKEESEEEEYDLLLLSSRRTKEKNLEEKKAEEERKSNQKNQKREKEKVEPEKNVLSVQAKTQTPSRPRIYVPKSRNNSSNDSSQLKKGQSKKQKSYSSAPPPRTLLSFFNLPPTSSLTADALTSSSALDPFPPLLGQASKIFEAKGSGVTKTTPALKTFASVLMEKSEQLPVKADQKKDSPQKNLSPEQNIPPAAPSLNDKEKAVVKPEIEKKDNQQSIPIEPKKQKPEITLSKEKPNDNKDELSNSPSPVLNELAEQVKILSKKVENLEITAKEGKGSAALSTRKNRRGKQIFQPKPPVQEVKKDHPSQAQNQYNIFNNFRGRKRGRGRAKNPSQQFSHPQSNQQVIPYQPYDTGSSHAAVSASQVPVDYWSIPLHDPFPPVAIDYRTGGVYAFAGVIPHQHPTQVAPFQASAPSLPSQAEGGEAGLFGQRNSVGERAHGKPAALQRQNFRGRGR